MAKFQLDYKKMKLEDMVNYLIDFDKKDMIDLNSFMEEVDKYELVSVYDADGKPKTYIGKSGKVKIKKEQRPTGKKTTRYNFLKAKKAFYNTFANEIEWINPPTEKKNKTTAKATDILAKLK